MKKIFQLALLLMSFNQLSSQTFNMCIGASSTAVSSGTIYDSGGPAGFYTNNEYCSFLINSGCTGTIALTFSAFSTEGCCDFLAVYNGSTTGSPFLGSYAGNSIPPTLIANSGKMLLVWSSDVSSVYSGWAATWNSTLTGMAPPVANFSMNLNPPVNSPMQFTDLTTNAPNLWYWQFGDGTTSTLQNPVKTYTSSGLKSVTLTASNCSSTNSVTYTLNVQASPVVSVTPASLSGIVSCGASTVVTLTLTNTGPGAMVYNVTNATPTTGVRVLAITNYVDMSPAGEYVMTFSALSQYFNTYTVTQHSLSSVAAFSAALSLNNVLLIPEQENYITGFMQTYSATINNFVSAGGTAILCGTGYQNQINDIGLFNCTFISNLTPATPISVVDTLNPIMSTVPIGPMNSLNATWQSIFTNVGNTDYVKYFANTVVTKRNIGLGRAIYIGFDYYLYDNNAAKIIANSVKSSAGQATWVTTSAPSGSAAASSSVSVSFTLNSMNLAAGVYTQNIIVQTNSTLTPTFSVPVTFSVTGAASASVAPVGCINFGTIFQNAVKRDSLILYNNGCATMTVSSMSVSNPVFNYTPTPTFTVAAFSSRKIYVSFNPVLVGTYNGVLQMVTNGGTSTVCLNGISTSAPSMVVSPGSLNVSLPACNASQTVGLTVANVGGSNLIYTSSGGVSSAQTKSILAITNYVDMTFGGEYDNMITAINSYYTNYTITQHILTSVSSFTNALVGKNILLIPEQESYVFGFMQTFSTAINNFASNGGIVIICGTYDPGQMNDIGLFNSSVNNWVSAPSNLNVLDTTDAITKTLPLIIIAQNATISHNFTSPGVVDLVKSGTESVVSKRTIGSGKAIYIGFDYYAFNNHSSIILANAIKNIGSAVPWLIGSSNSGTVTPGNLNILTYTFNSNGLSAGTYTYNILISSNDPLAPSYTVPVSLTVGSNPCSNFAFTNPNNCSGIVTFSQTVINPVTSYSWNFGNGGTSALPNPTYVYTSPGTYSVSLTACMNSSCSTITKTLNISNVGGPLSAACTPISYNNSNLTGIMNVKLNTINNTSTFAYLEGYQDFSCTNQTTLSIGSVYNLKISTSTSQNENVSVWIDFNNNGSFSNTELVLSSFNSYITHSINFTPPTTAVLNTPLRMRVIDEDYSSNISNSCYDSYYGQTEDYAVTIQPINVPPIANYNFIANQCQGIVNFSDNSLNQPTSWLWNFGDGGASTLQNPVHTYTAGGSYTVTLVATNSFGSSFFSQTITVNPLIFTIGYSGNVINSPTTFTTNYTTGQVYTWSFGDGNVSGIQNPTNTYTVTGLYTVTLSIVSGTCVNSATVLVEIGVLGLEEKSAMLNLEVFPNPFTRSTHINLRLAEGGYTSIELMNSLGVLVQPIANEFLGSGEHSFDLKEIAAGAYYLKVKQGNKSRNIKLISMY